MTLESIYKKLPSEIAAIKFLESIIWPDKPVCPYCRRSESTYIKDSKRYHCPSPCNTSFSVTVKTLFHSSKVDIQKWIYILMFLASGKKLPSLRDLGKELSLTKDTVAKMIKKIETGYLDNQKLISEIQNKLL